MLNEDGYFENMELSGTDMLGLPHHYRVVLDYPEIYREEKTTITLGMCHTRAADDIRISYESDRDGWVIEQASVFAWDADDAVCDPGWKEVAFIGAWGSELTTEEDDEG